MVRTWIPRARRASGSSPRLPQQPFRERHQEPAGRGDPRHPKLDVDRLGKARRGAFRLRAAARFGPASSGTRACWSSRARRRTCCGSPHTTRPRAGDVQPLDAACPGEAGRRSSRSWARRASGCSAIASKAMGPEHTTAALGDEAELDFAGLRGLPRSAQGERLARDPRSDRRRGGGQGADRRQRAGDAARLRRAWPAGHRADHGRRARGDGRRGAARARRRRSTCSAG